MTRAPRDIEIKENHDPLVDLAGYPFVLSPVYYQQGLSDNASILLRRAVADKLLHLQKERLEGLSFKIWDGYRPKDVQQNLFDRAYADLKTANPDWDDEKLYGETSIFVAPADKTDRVPPHATGGAVDLTLVDESGEELDMGTGFDHFGPEAAFESESISMTARENRTFLRTALESQDFAPYMHEWWHFDFGNQRWAACSNHNTAFYGDAKEFAAQARQEEQHAIA